MNARRGSTLIELLAVLAVMAIVGSVVTLALRAPPPRDTNADALLADARRRAIRARHPVTIAIPVEGVARFATAFPDGSVAADSTLGIDRLTGTRASRP
jgi:prepilin-type N-terminal cleavage/methylation domain-containing protein